MYAETNSNKRKIHCKNCMINFVSCQCKNKIDWLMVGSTNNWIINLVEIG